MKILIFANAFHLISGGDVIFAELSKRWLRWGNDVTIITNEKGAQFSKSRDLPPQSVLVWKISFFDSLGVYISSFVETVTAIFRGFLSPLKSDFVFASSFFWPDLLPAVITKIKNPQTKLAVGVYVIFPHPFGKFKYSGGPLRSIILYFMQIPNFWLINHYADLVFTASDHDRQAFYNHRQLNEKTVIAIRGGVDMLTTKKAKLQRKKYDAIYFGRLHSQKGLFDLLKIWQLVIKKHPDKKLMIVGGGPLEESLRATVSQSGLGTSVTFFGIVDGPAKYKLLKSAKVFISASRHDTGNIALDEVLACGVPGIVYDLPHLHYPAGVIKIPVGNQKLMAKAILDLLNHRGKRIKLGREGKEFIKQYDWNSRARIVLNLLKR